MAGFRSRSPTTKEPRQAPIKSLHSFLVTQGCEVPATSIHYAASISTPTCPSKSVPGPPEPTTFHCENNLGRSYSFTAITCKNPTSTHANLMIYGIFSDQLLRSIINGSPTEASEEPEDQNGYYSYSSD